MSSCIPPRMEERLSLKSKASGFPLLDDAAYKITTILRGSQIPHLFIGGYAASLFGRPRLPEDIDILVMEDCTETLLKSSLFAQSSDKRLIYRNHGSDVYIDVMPHPNYSCNFTWLWNFEWPGAELEEYEISKENGFPIPVLHPSTLILTKILPWYSAEKATRQDDHRRAQSDLEDIACLLDWLSTKKILVNISFFPDIPKVELLQALGCLYKKERRLRGDIAHCFSVRDLRDALNSLGDRLSG